MNKRMRPLLATMVIAGTILAATPVEALETSPPKKLAENQLLLSEPGGLPQGTLGQGTTVIVLEEKGDWTKVSVTGWVLKSRLSNSLSAAAPAPSSTAASAPAAAKVEAGNLIAVAGSALPDAGPKVESSLNYIGQGFSVRNVTFAQAAPGVTRLRGELRNDSGRDYATVIMTVTALDQNKAIIGLGHAQVSNLRLGSSRWFECSFDRSIPERFLYKIEFEYGF